ncbi:MAG: hypothetical protein HETSPECPRED_004732 [Heterodermia speciosa]|uniref:DASH complex subunit DAD2 n=1 Tax=Heterodermia speciosa TaxID=116794 RepID=A0A8H3ED25_9LECA|nr:MAG: hypothetical protein HETSPECPRED_004732 [Heterodermia speciosa]
MLIARINEKQTELESLKQLRDLSAGLAMQMQTLKEKLSTLSDGTEAVAAVLSNWHNVLRAINMASSQLTTLNTGDGDGRGEETSNPEGVTSLTQTLVRIPNQTQEEHIQEEGA